MNKVASKCVLKTLLVFISGICQVTESKFIMEVGTVVQEELKFRGVEFAVKVELQDRLLTVELSDIGTADQWRGEFDPACK